MSTTIWRGDLDLGFDLTVPVKLTAAARAEKMDFSQVNPVSGAGVSQLWVDKITGETVTRKQLVKQIVVAGKQIRVTEDEIDDALPDKDKKLSVLEFVKVADIDPIFYDSSYYILPADEKTGLYLTFERALRQSKYAALGQVTIRSREHLVVVRPSDFGLMLHTLFYCNEIREAMAIEDSGVKDAEVKTMKSFIRARAAAFQPAKYRDRFLDALKALVARKADEPANDSEVREKLKSSLKKARKARRAK